MSGLACMPLASQSNKEEARSPPFIKKSMQNEIKSESTAGLLTPINLFCSEIMLQFNTYHTSKGLSFNEAELSYNTHVSEDSSQMIPSSM
jgi:hypothetical protein